MVGAPHGGAKTIGGKDAFEIVFDNQNAHRAEALSSSMRGTAEAGLPERPPPRGSLPCYFSSGTGTKLSLSFLPSFRRMDSLPWQ